MSSRKNIRFGEAAKIILDVLPDEILDKPRKDIFRKTYIFREEFAKHGEENRFRSTRFSSREDLEKRVFCILEECLKGKQEFRVGVFDEIFIWLDA